MIKKFSRLCICLLFGTLLTVSFGYAQQDALDDLDALEQGLQSISDSSGATAAAPADTAASQPAPQAAVVLDIQVSGNQIVSTATILSKIKTQAGGILKQDTVNEDVRRLYATGFFQDIQMDVEEQAKGLVLIIKVVEKPVIKEIRIEGASSLKEDKLYKELGLIDGQILDRKEVKKGIEAIRKMYTDKGFRFVEINSDIQVNEYSKEATVVIQIDEGEKFRITDISFEGIQAFKDKQIRKLMKTKKKRLLTKGVFKESDFEQDLERIRFFYQQEGYLDVKIQPEFDYNRAEKEMKILIRVDEGKHYVAGDIRIEGTRLFPESEIWQQLEMLPGLTYSQFYLSKDVEHIRDYYMDQGHIDTRIIPDVKLNRETGKVDVVYKIEEGELYFVEKVIVRGNTKTRDIVIRRELRIRPGERFDGEKIRKSKQRLENLGFFEEITYDTEPSAENPNRKDLIFRVKEKRTGELSFGGGVSSVDRFVGFAEISQKNFDIFNFPRFTGDGQTLSLSARIGSISQDFNLNFVEPYLFNKPISYGTNLYSVHRDSRNTDFDENRLGWSNTISRVFKDVLRLGTGYTLERVELDEIDPSAPATVRAFEGENWLSRLKLFATVDKRDSVFNPTQGYIATLSSELVGSFLGGDQDYYILQANYSKYWTLFKSHVIEFRTRLATAQAFGSSDEVPIFDRFYAGGLGTVRGFNFRRVGPIDGGDAIGGESLALVNLEYTFPIPRLDSFRGAFFIDAGQVDPDSYTFDLTDASVSVGPGIKIKTPIGPVAFYYGYPIANRDTEDKNGRFEFSLSRGF